MFMVVVHAALSVYAAPGVIDDPKPYSKCWHRDIALDVSSGGGGDGTNVYYFTTNNTLEAAEIKTGSRVWSTDFGGSVISNLFLTDSMVLFATATGSETGIATTKSVLRAVSKQTGVTAWTATIPASSAVTLGVVEGKIVAVSADGVVSVFSPEKGSLVWSQQSGARIVAEPLFGERAILSTDSNNVIAVDVRKGVTETIFRGSRASSAVLVDSAGRILVGDVRGNLVFNSADGDRIWTFKNGARISFLLPFDSEFIAGSQDNFIYKLTRSGGVEWKRRLSGRVSARPTIVGHDAIISITGDPSIFVVDLRNGKILNRIEMGGDENIATRLASGGPTGFVVLAANGISSFDQETCPAK